MKRTNLLAIAALATIGATANAQTFYDNTVNFQGSGFANTGAATDPSAAANTITNMVADDINVGLGAGLGVYQFSFNVVNFNATAVSARARVRFYDVDATSGLPSTYLGGVSFGAISFPAGQAVTYTGALGTTATFTVPASGRFWAGITFDNNSGATGATVAQLNGLGSGLYNPPTVGSSADLAFRTTTNGSFLASSPAGSTFAFTGGNPVANFGWRFAGVTGFSAPVPEPATMAVLGLGAAALLRRRRKSA